MVRSGDGHLYHYQGAFYQVKFSSTSVTKVIEKQSF